MTNRRNNFAVPAGWSQQERRFGESIKQNLDTLQGNRGSKLDRAVTFRDLFDANIVRLVDGVTSFGGGAGEVTPTDPNSVTETDVPPAPTNLSASGSLQTIHLSWDLEVYRGHSHVEIHRHTSDNIANATLVAQVSGYTGVFGDPVGANKTYYYWVRAVNQVPITGPFNSSAGTVGQTSPDVDFILNALTDAITSSHLANSLESRIDLIDAAASVTGSVAYQVAQEATARAAALAAIFTDIPIHDSTADYSANQIVRVSNSDSKLYIAIQAVAGSANIALTNASYWKLYGDYDQLKTSTDTSAAAITQINTISSSSSSAAAQAIDSLNATVNDSSTGVAATSTALGQLTTRVTTAEGSITTNASDITALENTVNDSSTGVAATSTALGALTTRVTTAEGSVTTNASDITALENTVNDSSTGVAATSTALGALTTRVTSAEGNITTNASDITALETTVNNPSTGVAATASAVSSLSSTVSSQGGSITALSNSTSQLSARLNDVNGIASWASGTSYLLNALVVFSSKQYQALQAHTSSSSNQPSGTTADNAYWKYLAADSAVTVEEAYSATAVNSGDVTSLKGQYTVKIDANGHVAGFGLANTATSSGSSTSEFFVNADRFAVLPDAKTSADSAWATATAYSIGNRVIKAGKLYQARIVHTSSSSNQPPNDTYWDNLSVSPFAVTNSGETIGGVYVPAGVYINNAMIKRASITAAQIGSVNADTIDTGTLDVDGLITAGAIKATKLNIDGSVIISDNSSGTPVLTLGPTSISAAYIGTAAVETLKIAGNAVTVPDGDSNNSININVGNTYVDLSSFVTLTWTANDVPSALILSGQAGFNGNDTSGTQSRPATAYVRFYIQWATNTGSYSYNSTNTNQTEAVESMAQDFGGQCVSTNRIAVPSWSRGVQVKVQARNVSVAGTGSTSRAATRYGYFAMAAKR